MNIAFNQSYADVEIAALQHAIIAEYPPPPYIELMIERGSD